jgi:hypothetical protein
VPAGEAFSDRQREDIARAVRIAENDSGLAFSVYVGALGDDTRARALELHAQLPDTSRSALIAVDPGGRQLEIVTGTEAKRWLDDYACGLGAISMTTQFTAGDLAGGIINGLRTLAEHARHPKTLHNDEPA